MAQERTKPKGGCRMQERQDSHNKLALMVKIKLWRSKYLPSASYFRLLQKPVLGKAP